VSVAVTIQSLEIRFDVQGSDEERFAELFTDAMRKWARQEDERRRLACLTTQERELGDRQGGGGR
jgi:hypothetical protein